MEHISKALGEIVESNLPQTVSTTALEKRKDSRATLTEIAAIVAEVELTKQLRPALTEDQRAILFARLDALRLPVAEIQRMARSVMAKCTYGNIAFEHWVSDEVRPAWEINAEISEERERLRNKFDRTVQEELERRIALCRAELTPEADEQFKRYAELDALRESLSECEKRRARWYEDQKNIARQRIARDRAMLVGMNSEARKKVFDEAVRRGKLNGYDQTMLDNIGVFVDRLYEIVEEM